MKVSILDAYDRLEYYKSQADEISIACEECIKGRPKEFGTHPFYIFAHARTIGMDEKVALFNDDLRYAMLDMNYKRKYISVDRVPEKTLIWQPRLSKPEAQSNSMLFKYFPANDTIEIKWMIPAIELWGQYDKDKMTGNELIFKSIEEYKTNKAALSRPDEDDLSDIEIDNIYRAISINSKIKRAKEGASSTSWLEQGLS